MWDICILHYRSKTTMQQYIDPGWSSYPAAPHPELQTVTKDLLTTKGAIPFKEFIPRLMSMLYNHTHHASKVVLVSHGNYMLDKPLLEHEMSRCGELIPGNWYFFDTLPWFRSVYKHFSSYSLNNIYKSLFGVPISNRHSARSDTLALSRALQHSVGGSATLNGFLTGVLYTAYVTPLQRVRFIGSTVERKLIGCGVQCVEDLMHIFIRTCHIVPACMSTYLTTVVGIDVDSANKITASIVTLRLRT